MRGSNETKKEGRRDRPSARNEGKQRNKEGRKVRQTERGAVGFAEPACFV